MSIHSGHTVTWEKCPEPACVKHRTRWRKQWHYDRAHGKLRLVDATPARMHVMSLIGAGWSLRAIGGASGVSTHVMSRLRKGTQPKLQRDVAAKILAVSPDQVPKRPSKGVSEPFVPRVGTQRRIEALLYLGWSHRLMYEHSGVRTGVLHSQQGRWVTRSTHDKVAAMYRDLCAKQGPSKASATRARNLGYVGPLAWDDIDLDPEPEVVVVDEVDIDLDEVVVQRVLDGDRLKTTKAEKFEIMRRWLATGRSEASLNDRMGWKDGRYKEVDD